MCVNILYLWLIYSSRNHYIQRIAQKTNWTKENRPNVTGQKDTKKEMQNNANIFKVIMSERPSGSGPVHTCVPIQGYAQFS